MKKIVSILMAMGLITVVCAQSPYKINYQAVVRNADNSIAANTPVGLRVSILQTSLNGTAVYSETHSLVTNTNGLLNIEIGAGNKSWDKPGFNEIDWSNGTYFIKTEIDPTGGTAYSISEISQILSVPYALHARTAETLSGSMMEADPVFETSVAGALNPTDIANWNNKQDNLLAGKGIVIKDNQIFVNPVISKYDSSGGIAQYYRNDENIETDPNVVLFTNFEKSSWSGDWNTTGTHPLVTSNEKEKFVPLDGRALQVTVPKGNNSGLSIQYKFKEKTGTEPEEIYFRYYLRIGDQWAPSFSGKFPGIAGTYNKGGWGGRPSDGYNGWSARGLYEKTTNGKIPIGNYVYHADMKGQWGNYFIWNIDNRGYLEKNRWYCIEMYVKMNTPNENDGILRGWVDGEPAYEKTNLMYRKTYDLKIETIWLNVYHGGSDVAPVDLVLFIDNIVVARKYIGPKR